MIYADLHQQRLDLIRQQLAPEGPAITDGLAETREAELDQAAPPALQPSQTSPVLLRLFSPDGPPHAA